MKFAFVVILALSFVSATAFAEALADYSETIEQISSWSKEPDLIKYKSANSTLKAFVNAHNTAINKIKKEKEKIKKADVDFSNATRGVYIEHSPLSVEINKPMWGASKKALSTREKIKRDDTIKRAERNISSAERQKVESQKLALQDLRRKLKREKFAGEEEKEQRDALVQRISDIIDALTSSVGE